MTSKVILKENITRLIRDVKDVLKNPLVDNGIYYRHDPVDMLKGYALIIGPDNTPYQDGFFLFELQYPPNYPYLPPKVTYCTNGNNIRFNPNLYRKGNVCLSILNTWRGEQWTSCETIRSVLLNLCGIFTDRPLLNEPEITPEDEQEVETYNEVIEYGTYMVAILNILQKQPGIYRPFFDLFYEEMQEHFHRNRENILRRISEKRTRYQQLAVGGAPILLRVNLFDMTVPIDYPFLFRKIETI